MKMQCLSINKTYGSNNLFGKKGRGKKMGYMYLEVWHIRVPLVQFSVILHSSKWM